MIIVTGRFTEPDDGSSGILTAEVPDWMSEEPAMALALYFFGHKEAADYIVDARVVDEPEDREPTPEQERAWDLREDDARGHALSEPGIQWYG